MVCILFRPTTESSEHNTKNGVALESIPGPWSPCRPCPQAGQDIAPGNLIDVMAQVRQGTLDASETP